MSNSKFARDLDSKGRYRSVKDRGIDCWKSSMLLGLRRRSDPTDRAGLGRTETNASN